MPQRLRDVWCRELTFLPVLPSPSAAFFVAELPLEEDLTVLFGFLNNGARALNMTSIVGSVNSPLDFKFYAQNVRVSAAHALVSICADT